MPAARWCHRLKAGLYGMRAKGVRFVNVTPTAEDLDTGGDVEWLAIRPNTDAAMILALCHVLLTEKLYDREFLDRCTVGFDKFAPYLADKTPEWAEKITGIPATRIRSPGARDGGDAHDGQHQLVAAAQPSRRAAVLGAGDAGLACWARSACRAAASARLRPDQHHGQRRPALLRPDAAAGHQRGAATSSRSRASPTCCSIPAASFPTTGRRSPIPTSAWSTGRAAIRSITTRTSTACAAPGASPRRSSSTSSSGRRPPRWPTSCCPPRPASSATTSATPASEPFLIAMKKAREPIGEARDDYWIFSEITRRLGAGEIYGEGRDTVQWLVHHVRGGAREVGQGRRHLPRVRRVLGSRHRRDRGQGAEPVMLARVPRRSRGQPAQDAVGQDRDLLREDRLVRLRRLPRPCGLAGARRMAGLQEGRALPAAHAVGPADRQAAQPARPQPACQGDQGEGPPADHDASRRRCRARPRRRRPGARVQRPRRLPRRRADSATASAAAWCGCRPAHGSTRQDSGSNTPLEKHGNPNALTLDIGASKLSQGCIAQTCLVEIERFDGPAPPVTAHRPPDFAPRA